MINENLSKFSAILLILWVIGIIAMSIYVPFGEYDLRFLKYDVKQYDWILSTPEPGFSLINYKLISLKMIAWTATMWCLAYVFNNANSKY